MSLESIVEKDARMNWNMKKDLIIPDIHAPYEDYRALNAIYRMAEKEQFDNVRIMGDIVDFYVLSKFDKDPDRLTSLQEEVDVARYHLQKLSKLPKDKTILYEGNHEYRLMRYLREHPEFSSLEAVNNIPAILGLDDFKIQYKQNEIKKGVLFKHGNVVRKHSAYSAKGEYENEGTSGVSAHTHRLSSFYHSNRAGSHAWFEMGHLCDPNKAEYMVGKVPNWQQGFGVFHYDEKSKFWKVEQIPIINNSFLYNNKFYKWRADSKVSDRPHL